MLQNRFTDIVAYDIVRGAVTVERHFICEALPCNLIGMHKGMMTKHIKVVAEKLLASLGHPKLCGAKDELHAYFDAS